MLKSDEAKLLRSIHPKRGLQLRREWSLQTAKTIDRLCRHGFATWSTYTDREIVNRTDIEPKLWWFDGGLLVTLTERGRYVKRSLGRR